MADIMPATPRGIAVEFVDEAAHVAAAPGAVVLIEDGDPGELPHGAVRRQDGSIELPLRFPVTIEFVNTAGVPVKTEHYERLVFHRLLGADMRVVAAASAESRTVVTIARSARIREGEMHRLFDRMDASDITAASEVVALFLGGGRRTSGR